MNIKKSIVSLAEKFGVLLETPKSESAKLLQDARRNLVSQYTQLSTLEEAQAADETLNDAQRLVRLYTAAHKRSENAFDVSAKAQASALKSLGEHQAKLDSLFKPQAPDVEARHTEIRSMLREMDLGERMNAVRHALLNPEDEENKIIIHAVAAAPASISKAVHIQWTECRDVISRQQAPESVEAVAEISDELRNLEFAQRNFDDCVRQEYLKPAAELREKQQAATAALQESA